MKKYTKIALVSVLSGTLAACSSGDDNPSTSGPVNDPTGATSGEVVVVTTNPDDAETTSGTAGTAGTDTTGGEGTTTATTTTTSGGDTGTGTDTTGGQTTAGTDAEGTTTASDTTGEGTTGTDTTGGEGTTGTDTTGGEGTTTGSDTTGGEGTTTGSDNTGGDNGSTDGDATGGDTITPSGTSSLGNPPSLVDPFAEPIPSPDSEDPFGATLEVDAEEPAAGGAPTTPKNLRVDLVSNDWAELNWAKSNDDAGVVEYRLYRSDGHIYNIREDETSPASGTQDEIDKYWRTTSFIDCNYTRFSDQIHNCAANGPLPGETYSYQVTAVDAEGNESNRSNTVTVVYHAESNAPVPKYDDFYKREEDTFAQDHDLSDTSYFLDKFSLVFEDNFDGPAVDETKWNTNLTWADTRIINGEQQYFVNTQLQPGFGYDPFKFENGDLIIEAIRTPDEFVDSLPPVCEEEDPFGVDRCQFLSGALSSHDKFGMTYGYVEGRMKVGSKAGMLSSFYMYHRYPGLGSNLHGPEIDIVEYLGENPFGDEDAFQTYHFRDTADGEIIRSAPTMFHKNPTGDLYSDDYHTFGVLWEPQLVIWYIDGKEIKRLSGPQVARQQMNIVTYLVAGSAWAPTPADDDSLYPLQYKIDYIRAYQRPEYSNNGVYPDR